MAKKSRKKSVLARQKPRKNRKKLLQRFASRTLLFRMGAGILVLALAVPLTLYYLNQENQSSRLDQRPKVTVKTDGADALPAKVHKAILEAAEVTVGGGGLDDLQNASQRIKNIGIFNKVRVIETASNTYTVHVTPREPVLCAEADTLRLISAEGEVYGDQSLIESGVCPGPRLTGLWRPNQKVDLNPDKSVRLSPEEQQVVRDALELVRQARAAEITFMDINWIRYRGFALILSPESEAVVGQTPFEGKLGKLNDILKKLSQKGQVASRIELDYQGKAFVRLKKM